MSGSAQTAAKFWSGTSIKRSTDNGFTRPAEPAVPKPVRTDRQLASDEQRRIYALGTKKPPKAPKPRKPRKTVAQLLAPARNPIRIDGPTEAAKQFRIKRPTK